MGRRVWVRERSYSRDSRGSVTFSGDEKISSRYLELPLSFSLVSSLASARFRARTGLSQLRECTCNSDACHVVFGRSGTATKAGAGTASLQAPGVFHWPRGGNCAWLRVWPELEGWNKLGSAIGHLVRGHVFVGGHRVPRSPSRPAESSKALFP